MRYQAGSGLALGHDTRGQGRNTHGALTARTGQFGPHDLMAHNPRGHILKALALLAADLALVFSTLGTELFFGLEPFGNRFQYPGRRLPAHSLRFGGTGG